MKTYQEIQTRINTKLISNNQMLCIAVCTKKKWVVSNGREFIGDELKKLKRRLIYSKTPVWYENFDKWITGVMSEQAVMHMLAIQRGEKCQSMHPHISQNLNTGTPWIKGKKNNVDYSRKPLSEEQRKRMSKQRSGQGNPMFGKKHTQQVKENHSKHIKNLIKDGKFTPNCNNRQTHYDVTYNGVKYRSSWEALYHSFNPQAIYEELRILYTHNNKQRVYIVDFIDYEQKVVIEIKPKELINTKLFQAKWASLVDWARSNGYTTLLADQEWLVTNIPNPDLSKFDDKTARKVHTLYETSRKN